SRDAHGMRGASAWRTARGAAGNVGGVVGGSVSPSEHPQIYHPQHPLYAEAQRVCAANAAARNRQQKAAALASFRSEVGPAAAYLVHSRASECGLGLSAPYTLAGNGPVGAAAGVGGGV